MLDFSFLDIRLLFPNITESFASSIESILSLLDTIGVILLVVGEWKLFKKFGEKPWKSLVPYYNTYLVYKHAWDKKIFWVYIISSTLLDVSQGVAKYLAETMPENMWMTLLMLLSLPFGIIAAVCSILFAFRLAEAFGKGKVFSFGLLVMYSIFIAILGLGKSQYKGACGDDRERVEADDPAI